MTRTLVVIAIFTMFSATSGLSQDAFEQAKEAAGNSDYMEAVKYIRQAVQSSPKDEGVLALATKIYTELEILDSAVFYGARMYQADDDTPEYVRAYAHALTLAGNAPQAVTILRKLYKEDQSVETSLYLVNALVEADSIKSAELVATTAKSNNPKSADAYYALGILYAKYKPQPVLELAKNNLEACIDLDATKVMAHFTLAEVYWKMANREPDKELGNELFRRSLIEWNEVGKLDPRNARAWFEQGKIFFLSKKYKESVGALQRYLELRPIGTGNPIAIWYIGRSFFELQACDSAKIYLSKAAEIVDSLKSQAALMLGRCNVLTKQWEAATEWYNVSSQKDVTMSSWEPTDMWYFGTALVMAKDTGKAITVMAEAAKRDPGNCQFMFRYGYLLSSKGTVSESNKIFQQRLASCSDSLDGTVNMLIGNNFFRDSLIDSAIVYYQRAKTIESSPYILNRLAETYYISGKEDSARVLYEQVVSAGLVPAAQQADKQGAVQAILKLNGMDLTAKKYDDIINRCKTGLQIDPKNQWILLYTAFGYQGSGSTENACKWYKEVLKVDPNNDTAKKNIKALGC